MQNINKQAGIAVLELLIAFALITLTLTGLLLAVSGNQSLTLDSEMNNLALAHASAGLERAYASSTTPTGFNSITSTTESADIFEIETKVDSYDCFKVVSVESSWWEDGLRPQDIILTSLYADMETLEALEGDCVTEPTVEGWENPGSLTSVSVNGQDAATDIDVLDNLVYLTTNPTANNKDDFFIFEFDHEASPPTLTELGGLDLEHSDGAYALDVAGAYAYIAVASTTLQLRIVDISDPTNPDLVASSILSGVDPEGSYPQGRAIYYYNQRVYVGTRETAGPEFHVFDVSNPTSPSHLGSVELNHTIRDIAVRGDYAYLATTANACELIIIDVSLPGSMSNPCPAGGGTANVYNAPGNNNGSSVLVSGNRVYLGREQTTSATADDFFIIDIDDAHDGTTDSDGLIDSYDLGIQNTAFTTGLEALGNIVFVGLDDSNIGLEILDVSVPTDIKPLSACSSFNFSENSVALDMEGDYVFSANRNQAEIRIIYSQPTACEA